MNEIVNKRLRSSAVARWRLSSAIADLRHYASIQHVGVAEIRPVHRCIRRMGNAIASLKKQGAEVPRIDLTDIPREFLDSFSIHPETTKVAEWMRQEDLKKELEKKWGTKEQRKQRLLSKKD